MGMGAFTAEVQMIKGIWQLVEILVISSAVHYPSTNIPFI